MDSTLTGIGTPPDYNYQQIKVTKINLHLPVVALQELIHILSLVRGRCGEPLLQLAAIPVEFEALHPDFVMEWRVLREERLFKAPWGLGSGRLLLFRPRHSLQLLDIRRCNDLFKLRYVTLYVVEFGHFNFELV